MLNRRAFVYGSAAMTLGTPLIAQAQRPARLYRIGALVPFSPSSGEQYLAALQERLSTHGFVEGRNLEIEVRWVIVQEDATRSTRIMLTHQPNAIFALTEAVTLGTQKATSSVPIVFAWVADPVVSGIVKDYGHPGGNTTGVSNRNFELIIKRLELVRELLPKARRVALLSGYTDVVLERTMRHAEPAAEQLGLETIRKEPGHFGWARLLDDVAASKVDAAVVVTPFALFGMHTEARETIRQAMRHRLPVVYSDRQSVELGGLVSYATNPIEDIRRGADYLARVLSSESPANLAVDRASRFEFVINLKTARALGLTIPPSLLLRADQVIE